MKKKRKLGRKLLSFLLTLAMVVGLMPGMSLTAQAGTTTYTNLIPAENDDASTLSSKVVKFNNIDWYIIKDDSTAANAGTVTLLAKDPIDKSKFNNDEEDGNHYNGSVVKGYLDGLTGGNGSFAGVANAIETISSLETKSYGNSNVYDTVSNAKLYLLSTDEAWELPSNVLKCDTTSTNGNWWLRSPGTQNYVAAYVYGEGGNVLGGGKSVEKEYGVRPALKLNLSSVIFESNTFTVGSAKAAQMITASDVTATYGDTDKSVSASTNGNGAISYAVKSGSADYIDVSSDGKLTINKVPAEGKAYVTVTAAETTTGGTGGNGYAAATKDVTVNISKATVTITAKDQSIYVGGTVPTLSGADFYTVTGLVGTDTLTTAPTLAYQKNDSAATPDNTVTGTYDIVAFGASAGDNYNISYTKGALTIGERQPATVTKVPTAKTLTYNGQAQALVTAGTATGGTMQYAFGTKDAATQPYNTSIPSKTNVGTYYVWYKAVGDENHSDTEAKCLTVTISKKSSGGGSYTPSTPSTPTTPSSTSAPAPTAAPTTPATPTVTTVPSSTAAPTEDYTVPVTNENAVNVSTSITEGNAVVNEITQSDIDKIVNKNSELGTGADENTSITIDVSKAKSEVTSIELTKTTIERLADTTSEQNNSVDTVTVQMTNAKVELDAETLAAVSEQAAGKSVRLVVDDKLEQASLNEKQRDVISIYEKATTFEAYFESDGKRIHDFKGGTAKVSVRYSLVSGLLARFIHMLYLNPIGEVERFTTTYDGEWCTGYLPHFSEYAIVYDTSVSNKTGTEEDAAEAEKIAKDPYTGLDPEDWNADKNDFVADETTILPNGKTAYENGLAINSGLRLIQKGKTLTVTWGKVKGATGYKIYAEYCGTKMPDTPIKTLKSGSKVKVVIKELHGKKLNKKKNYKVCVVAYKTVNGVDKVLGRTVTAHVVGAKNKKYSNPKKLTIVSKTKLSLKTGKSAKIISKVTLVNKKRRSLSDAHASMFRYASTNKKVVTVNKKGKIKAVGKGQCYIWVYAKNGYGKKVKVTVS